MSKWTNISRWNGALTIFQLINILPIQNFISPSVWNELWWNANLILWDGGNKLLSPWLQIDFLFFKRISFSSSIHITNKMKKWLKTIKWFVLDYERLATDWMKFERITKKELNFKICQTLSLIFLYRKLHDRSYHCQPLRSAY